MSITWLFSQWFKESENLNFIFIPVGVKIQICYSFCSTDHEASSQISICVRTRSSNITRHASKFVWYAYVPEALMCFGTLICWLISAVNLCSYISSTSECREGLVLLDDIWNMYRIIKIKMVNTVGFYILLWRVFLSFCKS